MRPRWERERDLLGTERVDGRRLTWSKFGEDHRNVGGA